MNKSAVLGFAIGLAAFALVAGGYFFLNAMNTAQQATNVPPAVKAPLPAKPAVQAELPRQALLKPAVEEPEGKLAMVREIANGGAYSPGGTLDITLTIAQEGDKPVRALGIIETLPDGWTFEATADGNTPDLSPPKGRTPTLEFAWINVPEFPVTFTYRVNAPATANTPLEITGQTLYRTDGPELRTPVASSTLAPGGPPAPNPAPAAESAPAPAAKAAPPTAPATGGFEIARTAANGVYTAGSGLEVQVSMNYGGSEPVSALALVETLPQGWTFAKVTGGTPPSVSPKEGTPGVLSFVWINIPAWPSTFTYQVNVPQDAAGAQRISGQALYRTSGAQEQTATIVTEISPAG
jgi:hypothetical protein